MRIHQPIKTSGHFCWATKTSDHFSLIIAFHPPIHQSIEIKYLPMHQTYKVLTMHQTNKTLLLRIFRNRI